MKNEPVQRYSVLVIDDQANWRELLCEILEVQFDVTCAKDYASALAAIQRQRPPYHVVVTDMRLEDDQPGNEDGLRLAEYLKENCIDTKTILVTGYSTVFTATKALTKLGAYYYIEKYPTDGLRKFDIQQFKMTVHEAAEEAEKIRSARLTPTGITKYVSVSIGSVGALEQPLVDGTVLETGKTYAVRLSLQDHFANGAEGILLTLPANQKTSIRLDLFVYGEHLRVERGTEAQWELPALVEGCHDFEFTIIPEFDGDKRIFIEINQNHKLISRVTRTVKVIGSSR